MMYGCDHHGQKPSAMSRRPIVKFTAFAAAAAFPAMAPVRTWWHGI